MSICIGCGLCCDGTLFATADLEPQESAKILTLRGIPVHITDAGVRQFRQPCHAFTGDSCDVYDGRPAVCRTYSCRLFGEVEAGTIEEPVARSLIAQARALRDTVRPELVAVEGSGGSDSLSQLYLNLIDMIDRSPDRTAAQRDNAELLFSIVALRRLLAGQFEKPDHSLEDEQSAS